MDANILNMLLSNMPMVVVLLVAGKYVGDKLITSLKDLQEKQDKALDDVKTALNNNTAVITHLQGIIETLADK